jgi:hypothetical protein
MPLYDESGGYESGVFYQRFALIGQSRPDFAGQSIFTGVVIKDIIENYIGGYIEIVANSPVRINAAAPDGQKLLRPEAPVNGVPPSEYLYLTDPPVGEYEIEVEGTGDGSYAIDVKGSTVDGGVIEDSINGSITDGEVQTATVTMPETEEKDNINDVEVENVSLSPPTVDTSASQHTLSFVAKNVSTDGTADNFNITFPDGVTILIFSVENIDAESSNIVKEDSTFKFSLNPEGTNPTRDIPVSINVTMVADE